VVKNRLSPTGKPLQKTYLKPLARRSKKVLNHGQKRIRKNAYRYATNASFTSKAKTGAENADAI